MDLSKLGGGIDEAGGDTGGGEPIRILPEGRGAGRGPAGGAGHGGCTAEAGRGVVAAGAGEKAAAVRKEKTVEAQLPRFFERKFYSAG